MGLAEFVGRDPHLSRLERHAVDPARVVEHRVEPARGDVGADPLDDLPRRQRLAKRRDRASFALRG